MTRRRAGIGLLIAVALVVISAFIWVALKDDIGPYRVDSSIVPPNVPMTYAPPAGSNAVPGTPHATVGTPSGGPASGGCVPSVVNRPQGPGRAGATQRHTAVIRAWAPGPIQIGVAAPSARLWVQEWCAPRSVGWTVSVWGYGPYAFVFVAGAGVTCSIEIDGVVRSQQTTPRKGGSAFCRA